MGQMNFCASKSNRATVISTCAIPSSGSKVLLTFFVLFFLMELRAQETMQVGDTPKAPVASMYKYDELQPDNKKVWLVGGAHVVIWTGTLVALNQAWFADYERTKFQFFN